MIGIYKSRSVLSEQNCGKIPGQAKLPSVVRRMARLLDNPAIRVRERYEPIARQWLTAQFATIGEIRLIVDGTKVGFAHQLLMVALAYRKRAIPIAWTWVKHVRGHSTGQPSKSLLLAYVRAAYCQTNATVFLVGDTEFGSVKVLRQLETVALVLCLAPKSQIIECLGQDRTAGGNLSARYIQKAGQSIWLGAELA